MKLLTETFKVLYRIFSSERVVETTHFVFQNSEWEALYFFKALYVAKTTRKMHTRHRF